MGFFDNLTNFFTGGNYTDAAASQRNYLNTVSQQQQAAIAAARANSLAALTTGRESALGALKPAIEQSRTDISSSVDPALAALYRGESLGSEALTGAVNPAIAALTMGTSGAAGAYDPLMRAARRYGQSSQQASNATADALGLNGPAGVTRAQARFQEGPGFQFALKTGLDALTRRMNTAGGGGAYGGNILRKAQEFGQGLGQQEWDKYLANLNARQQLYTPLEASALSTGGTGRANALLTGGTGAANIYSGTGGRLADLFSTTGARASPVYTTEGQNLADLSKTLGLSSADIFSTEAARKAGVETGTANTLVQSLANIAPLYGSTYGAEAAAKTAGIGNLLNLGMQGLGLAAGGGFLPSYNSTSGFGFGTSYGPYATRTG